MLHLAARAATRPVRRPAPPSRSALPADDGFALLLDHALALPGVVLARTPAGTALTLNPEDALGPPDALMEGSAFGRLRPAPDRHLELVLPVALWREAVNAGIARPVWTREPTGATRLALLGAPADPFEARGMMDLVEASWAYARGL